MGVALDIPGRHFLGSLHIPLAITVHYHLLPSAPWDLGEGVVLYTCPLGLISTALDSVWLFPNQNNK